jgi:hypothetical protein
MLAGMMSFAAARTDNPGANACVQALYDGYATMSTRTTTAQDWMTSRALALTTADGRYKGAGEVRTRSSIAAAAPSKFNNYKGCSIIYQNSDFDTGASFGIDTHLVNSATPERVMRGFQVAVGGYGKGTVDIAEVNLSVNDITEISAKYDLTGGNNLAYGRFAILPGFWDYTHLSDSSLPTFTLEPNEVLIGYRSGPNDNSSRLLSAVDSHVTHLNGVVSNWYDNAEFTMWWNSTSSGVSVTAGTAGAWGTLTHRR